MTERAELSLSVLDSRFRITSGDARIVELVGELWEPFLVDDDGGEARVLTVEPEGAVGWRLEAPPNPPIVARDPWVIASTLRNAVSGAAVAGAPPMVPIHGAAVERDGVFLVLSGPARAGKTTLLLELLDRGWLLVTDDLVPLDLTTLVGRPFQKPLSVREPARWRRFSGGWDVPTWLPDPVVVGLIPATAMPHSEAVDYRPSLLVFPRYVPGAEPALRRLTPAETVAWCGDNLHSRGPGDPGVLPAAARLGTSTPGYAIRYGSSDDAVKLLENCLAGL